MAMPESDMMLEATLKCRMRMNDTRTARGSVMQIKTALRTVPQDQYDRQRGDEHFLHECAGNHLDGAVDQPGAVVERHDPHPFRQARLKLLNLGFDPLGHLQRVLAVAHHHHRPDRLVAVLLQHAAAELGSQAHRAETGNVDRRARFRVGLHDGLLNVLRALDPTDAADDVLGVPFLDHLAADRGVGLGDGREQLAQRHVVGAEIVGVDVDLVFDGEAAGRSHLGDAGHGVELIPHVPILNGAQATQVLPFAFDGIPENLAQGRGIGGQVGHDAGRQKRAGQCQSLQHPLSGEVEVDVVLEDDVDHREVELARRSHGFHARQALQVDRERVSDLVFDLLGAAAHPVGEDDHLVLREIGNRIDRRVDDGMDAPDHDAERQRG